MAPEEFRLEPIALKLTLKLVPVGVNVYHTSSSGLPVAHPVETPPLADAFQTVPELLVVPLVRVIAPAQSSLAGGPVTVILKSALLLRLVEPKE